MPGMRGVILGLSVGIVFCGVTLVAIAQDAREKEGYLSVPIGTIELKPPEAVAAVKSPVEFPHSIHFVYNCKECHHAWNLDAQLQTCTASECHDLVKTPKKENGAAAVAVILYFKKAYHQNCIGCHQEINKQNAAMEKRLRFSDKKLALQKSGPTGCIECHPKD